MLGDGGIRLPLDIGDIKFCRIHRPRTIELFLFCSEPQWPREVSADRPHEFRRQTRSMCTFGSVDRYSGDSVVAASAGSRDHRDEVVAYVFAYVVDGGEIDAGVWGHDERQGEAGRQLCAGTRVA